MLGKKKLPVFQKHADDQIPWFGEADNKELCQYRLPGLGFQFPFLQISASGKDQNGPYSFIIFSLQAFRLHEESSIVH